MGVIPDEKTRKETETVRKFLDRIKSIMDKKVANGELSGVTRVGSKAAEFKKEHEKLLSVNNMGLPQGIAAGIATFLFLRIVPSWASRRMIRNMQQKAGPTNPFTAPSAAIPPAQPPKRGIVFRTMSFGVDVLVSLLVGSSATMFYTDHALVTRTVAELPLVEGRSIFSETFCDEMIEAIAEEQESNPVMNAPQNAVLQNIILFGENCKRRRVEEARLRRELGIPKDGKVSIPPPGIPENYEVAGDLHEAAVSGETEFYDPSSEQGNQWAQDFVTDLEDDNNRFTK